MSEFLGTGIPYQVLLTGFGICLVISALGFWRTDWFISIGYGLSIAALSIFWGVTWRDQLHAVSLVQLILLCVYGGRLAGYLIYRERTASFSGELKVSRQRSQHIQGGAKLAIWISVSALYVSMAAPAAMVLDASNAGVLQLVGVSVMAVGFVLEMVADFQKSAAKAAQPDQFVHRGLFACVRYPNYLGEMVFWLGNFICGVAVYQHVAAWGLAGVGVICIELIMLGSARRLELKQGARYGDSSEYTDYVHRVPILFPWVPLYSLRRLRIYLG